MKLLLSSLALLLLTGCGIDHTTRFQDTSSMTAYSIRDIYDTSATNSDEISEVSTKMYELTKRLERVEIFQMNYQSTRIDEECKDDYCKREELQDLYHKCTEFKAQELISKENENGMQGLPIWEEYILMFHDYCLNKHDYESIKL